MSTNYFPAEAGDHDHDGQVCEVIAPIEISRYPDEWPFRVRFEDGAEIDAFASELDPIPPVPGVRNPQNQSSQR